MNTAPDRSWQRDSVLLFFLAGLFFCMGLGARPYLIPSEARYIEIPQQMLATHDWLTPRINGVPYFEKPPLFYWMQAAVMQFFGNGEFVGRIVTAMLASLTCVVTYAVGRLLDSRLAGWLSAFVLATSLMGYALSRIAQLDVPVSLFIDACIAFFLFAQYSPTPGRKRYFYWLMYVAAALGVMTKGFIGMVIPGLVIGVWIALTGRWRILKEARLITGTLIFLIIAAPWHILMTRLHPGFPYFYFIYEQFVRYTSSEFKRTAPWWFFLAITPAGLLPWTGLLRPVAMDLANKLWPPRKADAGLLFLALWVVLPLVFFSASESKLVPYIFPIFPPLAILLGSYLSVLWQGDLPPRTLHPSIILSVVLFGLIAVGAQALPLLPITATHKFLVLRRISPLMLMPLVMALVSLWYTVVSKCPSRVLIVALGLFGAVVGLTVNTMAGRMDLMTTRPLATKLKARLHEGDIVVAYDTYWQDLPVYLGRNVTVAGWTGELSFGVEHYPETHGWMISTDEFWKRCAAAPRDVYVMIAAKTYDKLVMAPGCPLNIVASYGKNLLVEKEHK